MKKITTLVASCLVIFLASCSQSIFPGTSSTSNDPSDSSSTGTSQILPVATSITLNRSSLWLDVNDTSSLSYTVLPSNAETTVSWSSSNSDVVTVNNGAITATGVGNAKISVLTSNNLESSCDIKVTESSDDYTVMVYICGSNLESEDGLATSNIAEMLSVNYPNGVNVILETGGAKSWSSTYGISASYLERYHISNKTLVRDSREDKASMGLTSTFQSFIEWGLGNYPAKQTGVVMWNHGGGMDGCCFDENYSNNPLTNAEVHTALKNAFASQNRTSKLDWIGYDCCLMSVTDIADFNSDYFDYMVASQETEPGEGWDYDTWLSSIVSEPNIEPAKIGKKIADSYVNKCAQAYASDYSYSSGYNDATMGVMSLTMMPLFRNSWEQMATELSTIITSSTLKKTFISLVNKCQKFGASEDYYGNVTYEYEIFDLKDYCEFMQASSTYKDVKSIADIEEIMASLISYNIYGQESSDACGLCFFCPVNGYYQSASYSSAQSNFAKWRTFVFKY